MINNTAVDYAISTHHHHPHHLYSPQIQEQNDSVKFTANSILVQEIQSVTHLLTVNAHSDSVSDSDSEDDAATICKFQLNAFAKKNATVRDFARFKKDFLHTFLDIKRFLMLFSFCFVLFLLMRSRKRVPSCGRRVYRASYCPRSSTETSCPWYIFFGLYFRFLEYFTDNSSKVFKAVMKMIFCFCLNTVIVLM